MRTLMRQEEARGSTKQDHRLPLDLALETRPMVSWVIAPNQMHDLLTAYWTSSQKLTGSKFDLAIEIAEDLGPVPCDYAILLLEIIDECVRDLEHRGDGAPSIEVRLSELRRDARLTNVVLEIVNVGATLSRPRVLSEGLLRLRTRTEEWNGFLVIGRSSEGNLMFRAALPIVSNS